MMAAATFGRFFASAASPFDTFFPLAGGLPFFEPYVPFPIGIFVAPKSLSLICQVFR